MQHQMLDHQEIEWQFDAPDLGAAGGWLEGQSSAFGLVVVPAGSRELVDAYYDTDDWRFYRAGYALRVRRDGKRVEATMKALSQPEDDGLKRRREISEPLRSGGMKALTTARGPVGDRIRLLASMRDLRRLFEVRTRRRIFELRQEGDEPNGLAGEVVVGPDGDIRRKEERPSSQDVAVDALGGIHRREEDDDPIDDDPIAEISLDESEFSGGEEKPRLARIEVEILDSGAGSFSEVAGFVDGLQDALQLQPTDASKFGTGLAASSLNPSVAPELGPTRVDASMSAGEVAFAILRRHFASMLAHEPGTRLGEDPEELHDMRVATRRMRAALKLYKDVLPKRADRYERDLRFFASALGEVRDVDVHLERLAEESNDEKVPGEIFEVLEGRRVEARRRMLEVLDSRRYEGFVAAFSGTLRRGRSPAPTGTILEVAPDLVRRRYKKVRKDVKALAQDSPPEDFHDLRKKGKRLRYALEPLRGIYGKPAERMVDLLKTVQDDLGDNQDLIVAAELVEELAVAGDLPPRSVFSLGTMAGRDLRDAAEIRAEFIGSMAYRDLRKGTSWKKVRKTMEKKA